MLDWARLAQAYADVGIICGRNGHVSEAEKAYRRALAIWEKLAKEDPGRPEYGEFGTYARLHLGVLLFYAERTREAEEEASLPADIFRRRGPYSNPLFYPEKGMRRE